MAFVWPAFVSYAGVYSTFPAKGGETLLKVYESWRPNSSQYFGGFLQIDEPLIGGPVGGPETIGEKFGLAYTRHQDYVTLTAVNGYASLDFIAGRVSDDNGNRVPWSETFNYYVTFRGTGTLPKNATVDLAVVAFDDFIPPYYYNSVEILQQVHLEEGAFVGQVFTGQFRFNKQGGSLAFKFKGSEHFDTVDVQAIIVSGNVMGADGLPEDAFHLPPDGDSVNYGGRKADVVRNMTRPRSPLTVGNFSNLTPPPLRWDLAHRFPDDTASFKVSNYGEDAVTVEARVKSYADWLKVELFEVGAPAPADEASKFIKPGDDAVFFMRANVSGFGYYQTKVEVIDGTIITTIPVDYIYGAPLPMGVFERDPSKPDERGKPIKGAKIKIVDTNGTPLIDYLTEEDGLTRSHLWKQGEYRISVMATNYEDIPVRSMTIGNSVITVPEGHALLTPKPVFNDVTEITESSARMGGKFTPGPQECTVYFEYGPTTKYGKKTPAQVLTAGNDPVSFSALLTNLKFHSTTHFRAVVTAGTTVLHGDDVFFQTLNRDPFARTDWIFTETPATATYKLTNNDSDADRDKLAVTSVQAGTPTGQVSIDQGKISYTEGANFNGTDFFDYTAADGFGGEATGRVYIVNPNFDGLLTANEDSRAYARLTFSGSGKFTGKLWIDGVGYVLRGMLDENGLSSSQINGPHKTKLAVSLQFDAAAAAITMNVTGGGMNYEGVLGNALSKASRSQHDQYTALFSTPTEAGLPPGTGYMVLYVSRDGSIIGSGQTGDGTPFTVGARLRRDGTWSLFAPMKYGKGKGGLIGDLVFATQAESDCAGTVRWWKTASAETPYPGAFSTALKLEAARYAPVGNTHVFTFTGEAVAKAVLEKGGLSTPIQHDVSVTAPASFSVSDPAADQLSLFTDASGLISGSFIHPGAARLAPAVKGVVYPRKNFAAGLFMGIGGSGRFTLTPQ